MSDKTMENYAREQLDLNVKTPSKRPLEELMEAAGMKECVEEATDQKTFGQG